MTERRDSPMLNGMTLDSNDAVRVRGLRKAYDGHVALDGVDLTVARGEVLALLGPNGAGKTTLVEILEGHRRADAGTVSVLGHDPARRERDFRSRIGIVLQETGLDARDHRARGARALQRRLPAPAARPPRCWSWSGSNGRENARAADLSGGQRRRLDLALGIAGDPELIFLDEPTTGFDPAARRQSWELIDGLRELGKTILLTTHYMDEAQHLADRVVVLANGRVLADADARPARPRGGRGDVPGRSRACRCPRARRSSAASRGSPARTSRAISRPSSQWAAAHDVELEGLTVTRPSLEDVYLELTA